MELYEGPNRFQISSAFDSVAYHTAALFLSGVRAPEVMVAGGETPEGVNCVIAGPPVPQPTRVHRQDHAAHDPCKDWDG